MKNSCSFLLSLFLALFMSACGEAPDRPELVRADSLMLSNPDSTLAMLDHMRPLMDRAEEADRAYYDLLRIKAQAKAYLPFTSDSLIRRVVRYYEARPSSRHLPDAYLYQACILDELNRKKEALGFYHKCLDSMEGRGDEYDKLRSLCYSQMGNFFLNMDMLSYAEEAITKACNIDSALKDTINWITDLYELANKHRFQKDFSKSIRTISKAKQMAIKINNRAHVFRGDRELARIYLRTGKLQKAKLLLHPSLANPPKSAISALYVDAAYIYAELGEADSALIYYKKLTEAGNIHGKQYGYLELSQEALARKDTQRAQEYLKECLTLTDSILAFTQTINLTEKQAIYKYEQALREKAKFNRKNWLRLAGFCLLGGLLIAFIATRIFVHLRRKNKAVSTTGEVSVAEEPKAFSPSPKPADGTVLPKPTKERPSAEIIFHLKELAEQRKNVSQALWDEVEREVNRCFPSFDERISAKHAVSQLELRVCHLLKLGLRPSETARLLNKSDEAVSAIRRRLCQKCFPGEQPSATRWDQFIDSL